MKPYSGKHAEYYDIIYHDKPYEQEAAFVDTCIKKYGSPQNSVKLLELACGSGRHALAFEQLGYQVLASDYSEDLLRVAQRRGQEARSSVEFRLADMRELDFEEQDFGIAACLFDSIGYVQTDEAIGKVLTGAKRHLVDGGLLVFEFWHAEAMLKHFEPTRVQKWRLPAGELLRIANTTLLPEGSLARVSYEIFELRNDLSYSTLQESQTNRYFTVAEMEELLNDSAFEALAWLNGFTWDEKLDDQSWHVLCVARSH